MYEHNRLNKKAIIKTVFSAAVAVILGLSLWLGKLNALGETAVTNSKQVNAPSGEHFDNSANPLLANKVNLVAPAIESKALVPSTEEKYVIPNLPDFTYAAKLATPAVVHVKARQDAKIVKQSLSNPLDQFFKEFFGEGLWANPREYKQPAQESLGSGVIYTSNGYIITNNHVIEGADRIDVTLNDNRCYVAKLIGADPVTDLALLKVEEVNLPFLRLGNSDKLEVGEWVLAVGNPFNLNSTVTKGIVSAKSRAFGGLNEKLSIQSFIQTDAAVNQGNSGGALVNLYGELVGINTAILNSRTATFMGYGFAIPSSLVKKVADDFIRYGVVQRVLLGVTISDVNTAELAKKLGLKKIGGVYIHSIQENSPCVKLFQKEDVITQINGRKIDKVTELQEIIGCSKPGDKVTITLYRKGKEKNIEVVLEKEPDAVQIVQKNDMLQVEGATFQEMDSKTKDNLKLSAGVWVKDVTKGKFQIAGLKRGYILLAFDKQPVKSIKELADMIRNTTEVVLLKVMDPNNNTKDSVRHLAVDFSRPNNRHRSVP